MRLADHGRDVVAGLGGEFSERDVEFLPEAYEGAVGAAGFVDVLDGGGDLLEGAAAGVDGEVGQELKSARSSTFPCLCRYCYAPLPGGTRLDRSGVAERGV